METVLYYLLKVSVSLSVVFLFYHLLLRKLTFYQWNRWFLLGYTALSFTIPFLNIESVLEQNEWSANEIVSWVPVMQLKTVSPSMDETHSFSLLNITGWVLLSGMIIMFCVFSLLQERDKTVKKARRTAPVFMAFFCMTAR